ncbi:SA0570 family protein [Staphylococcus kloosii]|jgi:hypothetical protein|uniref:Uncharacterized protein n=1 Tax=Staphylococcus kloosii TaxID=29384 RepID=A0A151A765_9STAP|nr:hypothetical protein [Staphylococcus kloosii]AVQ36926.1 hypothetical protein C7J89_12385 [Staphylococcus kloosii]KYH15218.1 hypothetical protein A0131_10625 [Staphylococcus kloosii]MBF7022833.1 hypothetical protein [Staphylococcus kloosii]MCD8877918.1 hypothetical protein [Staphylococcus kloosii]PNZ07036.1 hypothetical protein CD136_04155 [Staphylococcus kloosii]
MKKLLSAVLVAGITLSGVSATSADAATGNSIHNVKQLQQGDKSLEGAKIGASIQTVLKTNKKPLYSYRPDHKEHYYEFKEPKGTLVVTADGKKDQGKITRVSMSYNEPSGPSFNAVKREVSTNATTREHFNNVTGNIGYIQDNNLSYQFTSSSPKDKNIKLYRIDLQ